jgi:phosphate-selective porin
LTTRYEGVRVFAADGTEVIDENGDVTSWSTWVSFFVTGETKTLDHFGWRQPNPRRSFNPLQSEGPGAWELLFRFTATDTDESLFDPVLYEGRAYRILEGADQMEEVTLGLNWTWNPMVRWQFNYIHLRGEGILSGDPSSAKGAGRVEHENMLGVRMIFKF